uniref:ADP-ribosylation factor-like protein 16 n=1 Tax=Knipowitschia caucasica TaxID=637954 RepID=A0AAV2KF33_KNICA
MTLLCYGHCYASSHGFDELGAPPSTLPTVGTNLIEINLKRRKKVTLRELGGCMSPIWPSYYSEASSVMFMVDASNTSQISSSCIQLLSLLAAEPLQGVSVLLIFNKRDMPCLMGFIEMKSLFRLEEIIEFATQSITTLELSASTGQGLQDVVGWLESSPTK